MEPKHAKAYSKFLKLFPKSSVNFQNPIYSPSRDKRSDHHHHHHPPPHPHHHMNKNKQKTNMGKGFSGPMMSMSLVPVEARRNLQKKKNDQSLVNQEPTSPKISCMGQIKHKQCKKKFDKVQSFSVANNNNSSSSSSSSKVISPKQVKKKHSSSMLKRMFSMSSSKSSAARKSFDEADDHHHDYQTSAGSLPERAPGLSQMKKFASSRDTFASFDWTSTTAQQIAPETDRGTYYSYQEHDEDEDEDEFIIPFSAPIAVVKGVALQPRQEVNLWKRRTANPPAPLQLN